MQNNIEINLKTAFEAIEELKFFYIISPSVPEVMDFDGEMKPGFVMLAPEHTGLSSDLLILHPDYADDLLDQIGYMLKPVTDEDWKKANLQKIKDFSADMAVPYKGE